MDKVTVIFQLNAIVRELTCMDDDVFQKHINKNDFKIQFDRFAFDEPSKIHTEISIKKTLIDFN